jgi:glycosidase
VKQVAKTLSVAIGALALASCASESTDVESAIPNSAYSCQLSNIEAANDLRIYQVMVESFVNGNPNIGHGTGYGRSHHMGDIQGIIDSLDYIESLGMNGIWLTPVFHSVPVDGQSHWDDRLDATGYFATDYFSIDPRFGTLDDARRLVDEAHSRGLYVLFDGVFGHHKSNVVASPTGKMPVGNSNPVSYPESLPFYQEVAEYWIKELKIDGWRLDQAYQVPTEAWTEIRKTVDNASQSVTYTNKLGEQVNPLGYLVAEIWAGENRIIETGYGSSQAPALCSAFDFPVRYRLVETFAVNESGVGGKGSEWLAEGMDLHRLYPENAKPNLMLGNHDLVRFGDLLQRGSIAQPSDDEYWQRYQAVLSFQAAYSGPITLYYGDEIGDELEDFADKVSSDCAVNGLCDDHVARTSAKIEGVNATLNQKQSSLKNYVSQLMELRATNPALSQGTRTNVLANQAAYADLKQTNEQSILYIVNVTGQPETIALSSETIASLNTLTDLLSDEVINLESGYYSIELEPFEGRFLHVDSPANSTPIATSSGAAMTIAQGIEGSCSVPTVNEPGPVSETLYVVGDFSDSGWKHVSERAFEYKGNGLYQVVTNEKPGSYRMQYASKSWSPQYTAEGLTLKPGIENPLTKGGYGQDTAITLLESGKYVWSLKFNNDTNPVSVTASACND